MTTITLQATGYTPTSFEGERIAYCRADLDDMRGVELHLYKQLHPTIRYVGELTYITSWGSERNCTRLFKCEDLASLATGVRDAAKDMLPPGAGYPATPNYASKQAKLAGLLESLALHCLTDVLKKAKE